MNTLKKFEQSQIEKLSEGKVIPDFVPGDTVCVNVKIVEGDKERVQAYEGVCIARKNRGLNSSFTVRKISNGEGVERIFPLYSPRLDSVELKRRGDVRRSKLYYMRDLEGKAARIQELLDITPEEREAKDAATAKKRADKKADADIKEAAKADKKAKKEAKK